MAKISTHGFLLLAALALNACGDEPTTPNASAPPPREHNTMIVTGPNVFTQLGGAENHHCALRTDGVAECWGYNLSDQAPPTRSASVGTFTQVVGSTNDSCGLRADGVVECWGGVGTISPPPATKSAATGSFTQISGGGYGTCALRTDGVAECWGTAGTYLDYGQYPATKAAASGTFTQVDAGKYASCAVRNDGVVECWGSGSGGNAPPTKVAAGGIFVEVSVAQDHTCALRDDGVVECWGYSGFGQAPVSRAATAGTFTQVSAGAGHSCGLRNDGVVECWGYNASGEAPATRAAATGTFTYVEAANVHTCALRSDGVVECWGYDGQGQAPATKVASGIATVHLLPTATFSAPASVTVGQGFTLALNNAQVPGYSGAVTFSYAFDCGDGNGYGAFGPGNTASCLTSTVGTRNVKGIVRDQDGDQREYTGSVSVVFAFGGFSGPVDAPPMVNLGKAGSGIPVKFSLGGNQGLAILAAGYPVSQQIGCSASSSTDPIEQTVTAGQSSLSYDPNSSLYTYVWKTDRAWSGTCRRLTVRLADGREYIALFQFN